MLDVWWMDAGCVEDGCWMCGGWMLDVWWMDAGCGVEGCWMWGGWMLDGGAGWGGKATATAHLLTECIQVHNTTQVRAI